MDREEKLRGLICLSNLIFFLFFKNGKSRKKRIRVKNGLESFNKGIGNLKTCNVIYYESELRFVFYYKKEHSKLIIHSATYEAKIDPRHSESECT